MSSRLVELDGSQVNRATAVQMPDGEYAQKVSVLSGLIPGSYDEVSLTYVAAGNGAGEIETTTYKLGGVTIATLTLSYNASNKLSGVVRS